ncbi:MAG: hypothetical protein ABW203_04780 [Novosphingobium sp.]
MTLAVAQVRLSREVPAAERALDEALLRLSELMQTLVIARRDTGVPGHAGQKALVRLVQSQHDLISASSNMLRTHDELATLGRELCGPDENYCPNSGSFDQSLESTAKAA